MGSNYNIFLATNDLDVLADLIYKATGYRLEAAFNRLGEQIYAKGIAGIRIAAFRNPDLEDDEDDLDLQANRYTAQISFEPSAGPHGELKEKLCQILAEITANYIFDESNLNCVLFKGLTILLKDFH